MTDQIPEYEDSNKIQEILESGKVPENLTEEEMEALCQELMREGKNLITTTKSLENTMNELLNSLNATSQSTAIQMGAFMKALEIIDSTTQSD